MDNQPTIIKKVKKGGHGAPHGGAWKVAYADFVTAMMAFFLLLWLLNATTEEQKMGISNYFDPTAISRSARSGSGGVLGGTSITVPGALKSATSPPMISSPLVARPANDPSKDTNPEGEEAQRGIGDAKAGERGADAKEFIARGTEMRRPAGQAGQPGEPGSPGDQAGLGRAGSSGQDDGRAGTAANDQGNPGQSEGQGNQGQLTQAQMAQLQQMAQSGQISQAQLAQLSRAELDRLVADREEQRLREAAQQVKQAIQDRIDLKSVAENVKLEITPEGLRIQLIDQDQRSMFPLGSANMQDSARKLMEEVAKAIASLPNKITISGHTDSTPFKAGVGGYSNWELSADRANASRRALVANGVSDSRLELVVGKADKDPLFPNDPAAAQNRRISIVVLREKSGGPAPAPASAPRQQSQAQTPATQPTARP
jgi:chemotaxis protein MotB